MFLFFFSFCSGFRCETTCVVVSLLEEYNLRGHVAVHVQRVICQRKDTLHEGWQHRLQRQIDAAAISAASSHPTIVCCCSQQHSTFIGSLRCAYVSTLVTVHPMSKRKAFPQGVNDWCDL